MMITLILITVIEIIISNSHPLTRISQMKKMKIRKKKTNKNKNIIKEMCEKQKISNNLEAVIFALY